MIAALGTDRLFTVRTLSAAPGVHDYALAIRARRQAGVMAACWTGLPCEGA